MPELVEMPAPTQKTTFSGALVRMYLESEVCTGERGEIRTGQKRDVGNRVRESKR